MSETVGALRLGQDDSRNCRIIVTVACIDDPVSEYLRLTT
jgi:hypothetical protein